MTLSSNSKLAGFAFIIYIAIGITSLVLGNRMFAGAEGTNAKLAAIAQNPMTSQIIVLLTLIMALCALVLAVTIYALTRDWDRDLAMFAMLCRVGEGIIAVLAPVVTLGLLWIATNASSMPNAVPENTLAAYLFKIEGYTGTVAAICFSMGSMIYTYIFLRVGTIPKWLGWLGVFASAILIIILPLQLAAFIKDGLLTQLIWIPMLVFELTFAVWLIVKGVAIRPN